MLPVEYEITKNDLLTRLIITDGETPDIVKVSVTEYYMDFGYVRDMKTTSILVPLEVLETMLQTMKAGTKN